MRERSSNGSTVAIIGSGIAAAAIAHVLTKKGHDVTIFEKGPDYPYPHAQPFEQRIHYHYHNPAYELPRDLKAVTVTGDYRHDLDAERGMVVGGSATHWTAISLRMIPEDFRTRSLYGYGEDWPITYEELEPYYCRAEALLGVSGTDTDNPFAPSRSRLYPLPPFELTRGDRILAERLRRHGLVLHTTPQARTRRPYDDRPGCVNYGTCEVCPIGARYSPTHHLQRALRTGRCRIFTNVSVRRIVTDSSDRARAVIYQPNDSATPVEHPARVIVVAAGAVESARLLLLSASARFPDGLGNQGGHVGRHLVFHHLWDGVLRYKERLYAGRSGPVTGQSHQFRNPSTRGKHTGVKIELSSHYAGHMPVQRPIAAAKLVLEALQDLPYRRGIYLHAESVPTPQKYLKLSDERDRFGDPFAHVHYESSNLDYATYRFARDLFERFANATGGEVVSLRTVEQYDSGAHHMGTCRMGRSAKDSVVDSYGQVHSVPNLFLAGSAIFAGCSGAVNPTLTIVALALRTADRLARELR